MNSKELEQFLFDWSMSVTTIIPLAWINLDIHMPKALNEFLEEDSDVIADVLGLMGSDVKEYVQQAPTPLDRLDTLINADVNGFLCVLQGRVFERSGPGSWSSTCGVIEKYVYAATLEDLPKAISVVAMELKEETYPQGSVAA